MRLTLRAYILKKAMEGSGRISRRGLEGYYSGLSDSLKRKDQTDALTKAILRLIARGLVVGVGVRTKEKWFIKEVQLTAAGRRAAKTILSKQPTLPFRRKTARPAEN